MDVASVSQHAPRERSKTAIGAIHHMHGCEATWLESVPVTETFEGQTVWDGDVQVFTLRDHPGAQRAYAWSHATEGAETEGLRRAGRRAG